MSPVPADRDFPGGDADLDAAFAQIVAGWDDAPTTAVPPWPASEDTDERPDGGAGTDVRTTDEPAAPTGPTGFEPIRYARDHGLPTPPDPSHASDPVEQAPGTGPGPRDWEVATPDDEHFVPPDPPPLPRGDTIVQLAWACVLLGPAFLLFAGLFWRDVGRLWLAVAAAAFIGGFVALVMRLPHTRDEDDDNGAVV